MAITILEHPRSFSYAKNPISIQFDVGQTAVHSAILCDAQAGTPSQGSTVTFYFDDEAVEFIYDYSTFQYFYNDVATNYQIRAYFNASFNTNAFTLIAYDNEDLGVVINTSSNFAPCAISITQGGIEAASVLLGVDVHDGSVFKPTRFDKSKTVGNDGRASFNLSPAFDFPAFDFPSNAFAGFYPFITHALQYRLRYAEKNNTGTGQTRFSSSLLFALNGGFSDHYLDSSIHPDNYLTASPRFLRSRDNEPRFLSVIATNDFINCELRVVAYDFNNEAYTIAKLMSDMGPGELLHIPVSYDALELNTHPKHPFFKYELQFFYSIGSTNNKTEIITIEADRAVYYNYQIFLFVNSRGGIDTIAFTGDTEESSSVSKLQFQKEQTRGLYKLSSEQHRINNSYKQHSGYFDNYKQFSYLDELFAARQVWWFRAGELVSIEIPTAEFDKGSPEDTIWSTDFEFTLKSNDVAADLRFANKISAPLSPLTISPELVVEAYQNSSEVQ